MRIVETFAPGGQAGTSSRIENYLGFPTGISGAALAGRALSQAQKFGAQLSVAWQAVRLRCDHWPYSVEMADGRSIRSRAILIASGAQYRMPDIANLSRFLGRGIYYAATHLEAKLCADEDIVVVGGGNSAGQAAVFLASSCRHVHMLGPLRRAGREHVAISHWPHRGDPEHQPAYAHAAHGTRGLRSTGARLLDAPQWGTRSVRSQTRVPDDGGASRIRAGCRAA